jgi:hypothetical protein
VGVSRPAALAHPRNPIWIGLKNHSDGVKLSDIEEREVYLLPDIENARNSERVLCHYIAL